MTQPVRELRKDEPLSPSVSFILPVRDMQAKLHDRVSTILEVLTELTDVFDILLVDYGSSDDTREVAIELEREYPQVRLLDRTDLRDSLEALESAIPATEGEIVFMHDPTTPFSPSAVRQLWDIRDDEELVMAQSRPESLSRASRGGRVASPAWDARQASSSCSVQMLRRRAIASLQIAAPATSWPVDRVTRTDLLQPGPVSDGLPRLLSRLRRLATR